MFRAFVCLLMVRSCAGSIIALASANRARVRSPFRAASATFALKIGVWFRRGRLFMVSPDSLGTACPLSGRNSTYRPVQIYETTSKVQSEVTDVATTTVELETYKAAPEQDQIEPTKDEKANIEEEPALDLQSPGP